MNLPGGVVCDSDLEKLGKLGIHSIDDREAGSGRQSVNQLRRSARMGMGATGTRVLSLIEDPRTGLRSWQESTGIVPHAGMPGMRRGSLLTEIAGVIRNQFVYEEIKPNQIQALLAGADAHVNDWLSTNPAKPLRVIRKWVGTEHDAPVCDGIDAPVADRPALLLVHGMFSNSENLLNNFAATAEGRKFIADQMVTRQVILFDHPTMSVSPVLNALDLARRFSGFNQPVDVIAHSRGGLVTRWWLECFDQPAAKRRAVLVGSPLAGTSLAAPGSLRRGLSLLSNIESIAGNAAELMPWAVVVPTIFKALSFATNVAAKTPLVDAAIAMIPGLAAMSRSLQDSPESNPELWRLNSPRKAAWPDYLFIAGNYQPDAASAGWKLWRLFTLENAASALEGVFVFRDENDLVVDTSCMSVAAFDVPAANVRKAPGTVFHTSYFRDRKVLGIIEEWLARA